MDIQKICRKFFGLININHINLVDVRLYNSTQLARFSKSGDLKYFLKQICNCNYIAMQDLAPTRLLFDNYKNGHIGWNEYKGHYVVNKVGIVDMLLFSFLAGKGKIGTVFYHKRLYWLQRL